MEKAVRDVISQFEKPELLEVAKEFGLEIDPRERSVEITIKAISKLRKLIDDEDFELSDIAWEFAIAAEVIDENGNVLEVKEQETKKELEPLPANVKLPECYQIAAANMKDPSCKKCRAFAHCERRRIELRPECFGTKMYDPNNVDCQACIEFVEGFCEQAQKGA
jgi:hypothetical protein